MDNKIKEWFEKITSYIRPPFRSNDLTDAILQKTGGRGLYAKHEIDLSKANSDTDIPVHGDTLTVEDCPDAVTVKLNDNRNPEVDLQLIDEVEGPFNHLFINNSAGSGTLKFLTGNKGMFYAKKKINKFADNGKLIFGSDDDWYIQFDGTNFEIVKGSTNTITLSYSSNATTIEGGAVSGDDLILKGNSADIYPYIKLYGDAGITLVGKAGSDVRIATSGTCFNISHSANQANWKGMDATGKKLKIWANDTDTDGFIVLDGQNATINGDTLSAHYDLGLLGDGVLCVKETTTPTADTNYGKIYCKADNKLYFQDGAGVEHTVAFV